MLFVISIFMSKWKDLVHVHVSTLLMFLSPVRFLSELKPLRPLCFYLLISRLYRFLSYRLIVVPLLVACLARSSYIRIRVFIFCVCVFSPERNWHREIFPQLRFNSRVILTSRDSLFTEAPKRYLVKSLHNFFDIWVFFSLKVF